MSGGGEGTLTGPRLQGQDQDQRADDQVQAVEGPFPVPILLVRVHDGDGEQHQELHGQLPRVPRQEGVTREARVWAGHTLGKVTPEHGRRGRGPAGPASTAVS